jgi:hypothetical protein
LVLKAAGVQDPLRLDRRLRRAGKRRKLPLTASVEATAICAEAYARPPDAPGGLGWRGLSPLDPAQAIDQIGQTASGHILTVK